MEINVQFSIVTSDGPERYAAVVVAYILPETTAGYDTTTRSLDGRYRYELSSHIKRHDALMDHRVHLSVPMSVFFSRSF